MNIEYILIVLLAFVCEFVDSSLGMGYGTTLTPVLIIAGYSPLQIVPAVLFSEFFSGMLASILHHKFKNVNFHKTSMDLKVALVLSTFAIIGTIAAVLIAVNIPKNTLKLLISFIVISMGIIIFITLNKKPKFRWSNIITLGTIASINKGMSGGGYGPLVMGGQMLSGIRVKNAIGITSFSESVTCLVGVIMYYLISNNRVDWTLAPFLLIGAILSVPFATLTVKKLPEKKIKIFVAVIILILGVVSLIKIFV